ERELYLSADGDDLRGEDRLTGKGGRGFVIRFHLHPEVEASRTGDGNALLRLKGGAFWRMKAAGAVLNLAESVYLGGGDVKKTQQIVLQGHVGTQGATVKWALRREGK
ncbi:MAG TPA: heparinase II/III family protein, partial [Stellaceae bacterium]|nr:heparinase II/III family protein [Stellaceae bacterium]